MCAVHDSVLPDKVRLGPGAFARSAEAGARARYGPPVKPDQWFQLWMTLAQVVGGAILTGGTTLLAVWLTLRYSRKQQLDDQRANREQIYEALDRQTAQRDAEALRVWHTAIRDHASNVHLWLVMNRGKVRSPDDPAKGSAFDVADDAEEMVGALTRSRNPAMGSAEHEVSQRAKTVVAAAFTKISTNDGDDYPHVERLNRDLEHLQDWLAQEVARLDRKATGRDAKGNSELDAG
jgi:hypothetical protein